MIRKGRNTMGVRGMKDSFYLPFIGLVTVVTLVLAFQVLSLNTAPKHSISKKEPHPLHKRKPPADLSPRKRRKKVFSIFDIKKRQPKESSSSFEKPKSSPYYDDLVNGEIESNLFRGHNMKNKHSNGGVLNPGTKQGAFLWLHTDKTVLLYSAHYDHSTRSVLFMGFKHRYVPHVNDPPSICIIPAGTISPVAFKPHYNISLEEDTSLAQYDSFIWACKLDNPLMIPRHVLVGYALPHKPAQFAKLKVSATDYKSVTHEKMNFVVCVKPLPHGYGDTKMIFEYIQMAKMFGADRVVLYNQEFQRSLLRVFSHFQLEGVLDIYDWVVRAGVMYLRGEKAAQQHCLLTYRYQTEHIIFLDFNEMVIPEGKFTSWSDIVDEAERIHSYSSVDKSAARAKPDKLGAILVPMRQINMLSENDAAIEKTSQPAKCGIDSLLKTQASDIIPKLEVVIAKAAALRVVDNYSARELYSGYSVRRVTATNAVTHRYVTQSPVTKWHTDRTMHRFITPMSTLMSGFCAEQNLPDYDYHQYDSEAHVAAVTEAG